MNEKKFLDDFLIKKTGQKGFKNLSKKNLINDGILDSLDVVTLSFLIKKKFNIDIKMNEKKRNTHSPSQPCVSHYQSHS